jgi:FixJ family two-component response regulator
MAPNDAMTIAIVDDDDDVRTGLARLLRSMGNNVSAFASAEEFLAARAVGYDCLIVDVRLPGLNGLELRDLVRSQHAAIPVILITGDGDRRARELACSTDSPSLTKPFDDDALMAAISAAVSSDAVRERNAS